MTMSRRSILRSGLYAGALATIGYSTVVEPNYLQRSHYTVTLPRRSPEPDDSFAIVRVLHLSDLHYSANAGLDLFESALSLGMRCAPDIIAISGDLIDLRLDDPRPLTGVLKRLVEYRPTFVTFGNHDGGSWARSVGGYLDTSLVEEVVHVSGATLLNNSSYILAVARHRALQVVGLSDLWSGSFSPQKAFDGTDTTLPTLLISHNPDSKDLVGAYRWDLMLAGHSHGGQLRIPIAGATPFAPVKDKRYVAGLNEWRDRSIFTSNGIATTANFRFNVRPEVTIFDLLLS